MQKIQVIVKAGDKKSEALIASLKKNKVNFSEWFIDDNDVKKRLLDDGKFSEKFCDFTSCEIAIPIIRVDETGEYHYKTLFGNKGLQVDVVKKIIGMR
nr:hypothetical protein [Candidatus Sigynarchaeota archaeon]